MEKYGFVYIWFDKKHKRYYIGSHWGTENDGYVCSSRWMRKAYKRRPEDFKRRLISKINTNRKDLLEEEYRWLSLISDEEIKSKKYYNITKHKNGHWSAEDYEQNIKLRISQKTKEAMAKPEVREKYLESLKNRNQVQTDETKLKRSETMKKTMAEKFPEENRWKKLTSEERTQYYSDKAKANWCKDGFKEQVGAKISESLKASKDARSKHMSSLRWWNNGIINKRMADCPGDGYVLGKI